MKALLWRNDARVWRWCRQNTLISNDAHQRWLDRIERDPSIKMFGIAVNDERVGVCGLTSISPINQSAEFSLYIAPEHQGNGHGKKALLVLLRHGFLDLNLNRIWGESFDGNPAKKTFLEIGMRSEGVLRETYFRQGRFIDSEIFSMLRSEYVDRYDLGGAVPFESPDGGDSVLAPGVSPGDTTAPR